MVAEVRGGGVVEQGLYPGATHCHPVFRAEWARLLSLRWGQPVLSSLQCILMFLWYLQDLRPLCVRAQFVTY